MIVFENAVFSTDKIKSAVIRVLFLLGGFCQERGSFSCETFFCIVLMAMPSFSFFVLLGGSAFSLPLFGPF